MKNSTAYKQAKSSIRFLGVVVPCVWGALLLEWKLEARGRCGVYVALSVDGYSNREIDEQGIKERPRLLQEEDSWNLSAPVVPRRNVGDVAEEAKAEWVARGWRETDGR